MWAYDWMTLSVVSFQRNVRPIRLRCENTTEWHSPWSLLPRSVEKRPIRLRCKNTTEWHSPWSLLPTEWHSPWSLLPRSVEKRPMRLRCEHTTEWHSPWSLCVCACVCVCACGSIRLRCEHETKWHCKCKRPYISFSVISSCILRIPFCKKRQLLRLSFTSVILFSILRILFCKERQLLRHFIQLRRFIQLRDFIQCHFIQYIEQPHSFWEFFCYRVAKMHRITGHVPQKNPIISDSFAERDLQLKASYRSSPPCNTGSASSSWEDSLLQQRQLFCHFI